MTAQIGVRIGPAACARALSQQGRGLRLEIDTATGDTVTIWSSSSELTTAADIAFARTLLDAADRFLAECERHCPGAQI